MILIYACLFQAQFFRKMVSILSDLALAQEALRDRANEATRFWDRLQRADRSGAVANKADVTILKQESPKTWLDFHCVGIGLWSNPASKTA
jgi:hypothetical protein